MYRISGQISGRIPDINYIKCQCPSSVGSLFLILLKLFRPTSASGVGGIAITTANNGEHQMIISTAPPNSYPLLLGCQPCWLGGPRTIHRQIKASRSLMAVQAEINRPQRVQISLRRFIHEKRNYQQQTKLRTSAKFTHFCGKKAIIKRNFATTWNL